MHIRVGLDVNDNVCTKHCFIVAFFNFFIFNTFEWIFLRNAKSITKKKPVCLYFPTKQAPIVRIPLSSTVLLHLLGCWCNTKAIQIRNNIRLNNLRINQGSPEEFRMIQPNKETNLQHKVKRNAIRQRSNSSLQNRKERKDNPVSKPLCILGRISGVNGLERHVGGVEEGD
mmetsp:Transcript_31355/g.41677  ORF Transcript_31355/g.41677 Transcript_31355/m.41677 type:complete len:171 (-) Transcript_31355:52-564(-)